MSFSCTMGRHAPVSRTVRNQGLRFGRCRHCRRDVIHLRGGWVTPPHGLRIVWRSATDVAHPAEPKPVARPSIWRVAALVDVLGAGLRMAGWALAAQMRALLRRRAVRPSYQPILSLTLG